MAYVAIADQHAHLHDPQTFVTKYIWSQDHKVIAIQYAITAMAIGLVALGLSVMMRMQLGFPDTFRFISPDIGGAFGSKAIASSSMYAGSPTLSISSARTTITSSSPCTA